MQNSLYRSRVTSDHLGRYYTAAWISEQLINQINIQAPSLVMEFGAGAGALSKAAHDRWEQAELVTVDLDDRIFDVLKTDDVSINHRHYVHDVLDYELDKKINLKHSSVDVAICNPPYVMPLWRDDFLKILESAGFIGSLKSLNDAGADLLFIAQNLRFLRDGGQLGIILPDGLITGDKYNGVRRRLVENYTLKSVIQLPKRVFSKTEAQTYLVILEKTPSKGDRIALYNFESPSCLSEPIFVNQDEAACRLDYKFHSYRISKYLSDKRIRIADSCEVLIRGVISSSEISKQPYPVFHLTDFLPEYYGKEIDLPASVRLDSNDFEMVLSNSKIAIPGDILIARIGRGLESKVCMIRSGSCVISDCIFSLRLNLVDRENIFKYLSSELGRNMLASLSRGVGASHISKTDILNIEI